MRARNAAIDCGVADRSLSRAHTHTRRQGDCDRIIR